MYKEILETFYPEMVELRREFHRYPELSFKEVHTSAMIMEKLKAFGCDTVEQMYNTGVVATIKGGLGEGKCIGLRADIDALPVTEETGALFASRNPGVMHACGHDIHITSLLAAARILCQCRDQFRGTVKLIFQPGEEAASPEDPHGGAYYMVQSGCLENPHVDAMVGLHNNPSAEGHGVFAMRKGVCTSGFDLYQFNVYGKTAHGSAPHMGNDAIVAISNVIVLLQQIIARNVDPLEAAVVNVGTIKGGSRVNIVPDFATAGAVFRYYNNDVAKVIYEHTCAVCKGVEEISGCRIEIEHHTGYACVENDDALTDLAAKAIKQELGEDSCFYMKDPVTGSEDFSEYHLVGGIPTTFMWVNARPMEGMPVAPLHNSKWCPDVDIIRHTAPAMAAIAVEYLNS